MHHCYSLDLRTQQIWDYVGDTYVHRLNQSKVDGKSGEMNSCISHEGDCRTCEHDEDSGINEALYSSKIEAVCFSDNFLWHACVMNSLLFTSPYTFSLGNCGLRIVWIQDHKS